MFLTVTPNACLDRVLYIQRFEPTTTMRTRKAIDAVGGKGLDVSVALRCLGQDTVAVGFIAGKNGTTLQERLASYGIHCDLIEVEGETRIAHVIIEEVTHQHSHITTQGYAVTPDAYQKMLDRFNFQLADACWVATGGSLPEGMPEDFFNIIAQLAHQKHIPILLDVSGRPAELALPAIPEILKMNHQEFQETFSLGLMHGENLETSIRELVVARGLKSIVITCGSEGIIAVTPEGSFKAFGLAQEEVNAAGAGDAASAALLWRLSQGDGWGQAIRWAAAAGAATVLTEATAECDLRVVEEILPCIELKLL